MIAKLLYGAPFADRKLIALKKQVNALKKDSITPTLAVVLVGDDPASHTYVGIKERRAQEIGLRVIRKEFSQLSSALEIIKTIKKLNHDKSVHGIIVQLPLPAGLPTTEIINAVATKKDVDGLREESDFSAPTPLAIMFLLERSNVTILNKHFAIVGHGRLVGKPLALALKKRKIDYTIYEKDSIAACCHREEIVVSATGTKVIFGAMLKPGAVVVDAAADIDEESVPPVAGALAPRVGGIGPLTVAFLLENVLLAAKGFAKRN